MALPDQLTVEPIAAFDATVHLPGSKSLTNRALLLAALAEGASTLDQVLLSDDTRRMLEALQTLGFALQIDKSAHRVCVRGKGGRIPAEQATLNLGNAGTAMRSLTAACCLGQGTYTLDGIARMRERPIGELVDPLRELGGQLAYLDAVGYPPVQVFAGESRLSGGTLTMRPTLSSQFISALLMIGPYCAGGLTLRFDGPVTSWPYVQMTIALMRTFGADVQVQGALDGDAGQVHVAAGGYGGRDYRVEPDASNASYFLAAAAAIPGSRCRVKGLGSDSVQGDVQFAHVLEQMGAQVRVQRDAIEVAAPADGAMLRGVDVDLNAMPDMAQTLATLAVLAEGATTIRNVGNLRVKETDRLAALQMELTRLGARAMVLGDDLQVSPPATGQVQPAVIQTYDDHRMAMSFAIIGLARPGVTIDDPACVNKTFPDYFQRLEQLGGRRGAAG